MKNKFRIFCAIPRSANNYALKTSNIWYKNLVEPLIKMGHEVISPSFDVEKQHQARYLNQRTDHHLMIREKYNAQLVKDIRQANQNKAIDFVLTYYDSFNITPEAIDNLRQIGPPIINFSCNNAHQFNLVSEIAPHFDFCIVPEKQAIEKYNLVGAKPLQIQMAANPEFYRPYNVRQCYDVTFVGQKYLNRSEYINYIYTKGINIKIWGPGWRPITLLWSDKNLIKSIRHLPGRILLRRKQWQEWEKLQYTDPFYLPKTVCKGILSDKGMVRMYSQSKISLNFSEVEDEITGEIKRHIRLRDFEAPMSGAFYITGYQDELTEYYDIGKEIVCYDTKEELLDKIRYYLKHPQERIKICEAGMKRARRDHTWEKRFEQLFLMIGLNT